MNLSPSLAVIAALTLGAAVYVHLNVHRFVAATPALFAAHGVLLCVGLGLAYVGGAVAQAESRWAASLIGFGIVHVPAAAILLLKRARRSPKT